MIGCQVGSINDSVNEFDAYLPFVESVDTRTSAYVGDELIVTLTLSSAARPGLLDNIAEGAGPAGSWPPGPFDFDLSSNEFRIYPWINPTPKVPGTKPETVQFKLTRFIEPGTYTLLVQSAPTASQGGAPATVLSEFDYQPPVSNEAVFLEPITITVLPAEDAPGEGG
jgi:hypothetical protein